ncbi:MAG: MarR family transcriptional regulator [Atopobiaceae bacterium]
MERRACPQASRLTFEEFAVLCHLHGTGERMKTSDIASYQGSLRPTMTHRMNHLVKLGFVSRAFGLEDRRNVWCTLTDEGAAFVEERADGMRRQIIADAPTRRLSKERIIRMSEAMGTHAFHAGDLMLLGLKEFPGGEATISDLVKLMGLLQPTVSMSIAALEEHGYVLRRQGTRDTRSVTVALTEAGESRALELEDEVQKMSPARSRVS